MLDRRDLRKQFGAMPKDGMGEKNARFASMVVGLCCDPFFPRFQVSLSSSSRDKRLRERVNHVKERLRAINRRKMEWR